MMNAILDTRLNAVTVIDPSNNSEPLFFFAIFLQRKNARWSRVLGGGGSEEWVVEENPSAPDSGCYFRIPLQLVVQPDSCSSFLAHMLSGFNLSAAASNFLTSKLASFIFDNLGRGGPSSGFYITAHVEIIEQTVVDEVVIFDSQDILPVSNSRGGSEKVLKNLKKERFYMKVQGDGSSSATDACAVCLEDFATTVELIKLPACGHIFHEKCIFGWLHHSKSCPLCRTQVE